MANKFIHYVIYCLINIIRIFRLTELYQPTFNPNNITFARNKLYARDSSERIKILDSRLVLLRWMQTTACLGFIANLMTIFLRYFELYASSLTVFGLSIVLMIISILLYVIETQQSHLALSNHVNELKNIQE